MSARAVSEFSGKEILYKYFEGTGLVNSPYSSRVKIDNNFNKIGINDEWLTNGKGVIKPDQLIKGRGKMDLVKIGSPEELNDWLNSNANRRVKIGSSTGTLQTFIVEPFCDHQEIDKMYIAITSNKEKDTLMFLKHGGGNIGNVESKARFLKIPVQVDDNAMSPTDEQLDTLIGVDLPNFEVVKKFVDLLYKGYKELHFTYLEINSFVFVNNQIHIIDLAAKLDKSAFYTCRDKWRSRQTPMSAPMPVDFPAPFGRDLTEEEQFIAKLDAETGASLKLTTFNRNDRVSTIFSNEDLSLAFRDFLGKQNVLANMGEYSDDSSVFQVFTLTDTILSIMIEGEPRSDGKILIICGSITNFMNDGKNFEGIVKAIEISITKLKEHEVTVYVRCDGPNYQEGLRCLKDAAAEVELPVHVFGPETNMAAIVGAALGTNPLPSIPIEPMPIDAHRATGQFLLSPERNTATTERQPASPESTSTEAKPSNQTTFRGLFENDTKAIIWGEQTDAIQGMLDFDHVCLRHTPSVVASIYPSTEDNTQKYNFGLKEVLIPAYKSMAKAFSTHPEASVMVTFAPTSMVYGTVLKALEFPQLKVIAIIAEGVPENRTRKLLKVAAERGVTLIGPATVGGIKPGCFKIGYTGGMMDNILSSKLYRPGSVAYVSRSGGMSNELNNIISQNSNGVYEGIAIGGDRYTGSSYVEHIARYQADDRVKMIVLLGKVGGTEEYKIVEMLNRGEITKPLVAWCIGTSADHITNDFKLAETADCKNAVLRGVGAIVPISFGELGNKIRDTYEKIFVPQPEVPPSPVLMDYALARDLGLILKPASFMTSVCDERREELFYGGVSYTKISESGLGIGTNLGLFWFEKNLPLYVITFIEMAIIITSNSHSRNDFFSGRTTQNRYGGALDDAVEQFTNAVDNGWSPMQFVNHMADEKKRIAGIGHSVYNKNKRYLRVESIKSYAMNRSEFTQETPLLEFALEVEKIMTAKKPNLILNVDGLIGVVFVDILRHSKCFTPAEAQEIIDSRTLNALLIFGRRLCDIGFFLRESRLFQGHH